MSTPIIQKVTKSKPFEIYSVFCLIRGVIVVAATACFITCSAIEESRRREYHPSRVNHATAHKTEPRKVDPYQCPYQTHFKDDDESSTKLY